MIRKPVFKVGDRVVIISKYDGFLGQTGTIIEFRPKNTYPWAVTMDTGERFVWCFTDEIHPADDDPDED